MEKHHYQFNLTKRQTLENLLNQSHTAVVIASTLSLLPTCISREIIRHRVLVDPSKKQSFCSSC